MTEPSLRTHFQSLVATGREVEAVAQLKTLIQSLPDQSEKSGIHLLLSENPIPWERVLERLKRAWGALNPEQARDYTTIIGHDNVALSNIFSSIIQINLGKAQPSGPHFLTLDHPAVRSIVIGRQTELQSLEELMATNAGNPVVIWGASGIGKTLLAELYWEKHKGEYAVLGWLNYHTSLANTIVTEIMPQYADYPDLDKVYDKKLEWTAKKYILHELQNRAGKKLVVLNNVPLGSDVAARLEWLNNIPDLQLLITANEALEGTSSYALPPLSEEEIVDLFKVLSGQEVDADIAELLGQLGQNALLTRLIARNIPAADLHRAKEIIQGLHAALHEESEEEQTAEQRLLISLLDFSLQDAAERWVLLLFAAMPAMEMELGYFKALVLPDWSQGDVFDAEGLQHYLENQKAKSVHVDLEGMLKALVEKGWLEMVEDRYVLPEVVRMVVELHYESYAAYFVELVEALHLSYFGEEFGKVKGNALFVAHLKGVLPYLEYGEVYLGVHRLLIKTLNDLVNWGEEVRELGALLAEIENNEGIWCENYWSVCEDLAGCYHRTGQLNSAKDYSKIQLEIAQKIFPKHTNFGTALNQYALVLSDLGDLQKATELLEFALNHCLQYSRPGNPNIATIQSNLGLVLGELKDYSRAITLLEVALTSNLLKFGPNHPDVATCQSRLAGVLSDLGEHERATQLIEIALASDLLNFGPHHPNVTRKQLVFAKILSDLGKYEQAAQLLEEALKTDQENFGSIHPHVAIYQYYLAKVYIHQNRIEEAQDLIQESLATLEQIFSKEHPSYTKALETYTEIQDLIQAQSSKP